MENVVAREHWNARKLCVPKEEGNGCAHMKWFGIVARVESHGIEIESAHKRVENDF